MSRRQPDRGGAGRAPAALAALAVIAVLAWRSAPGAPPPPAFADVRAAACPSEARLLDRHGDVLHEQRVDRTRRRLAWTALADVSPALRRAVIASEDRRFQAHAGVDLRALGAALWQRLRGGPPRGASTISMQLAALLDPALARAGAPRTLADKWAQMRAAWALERAWSKDEILEAYLNLVSFRGELQGVAAAAELLFHKAPHGLTIAEANVLAALLRGPNADRATLARRAAALAAADDPALDAAVRRAVDAPATAPRRTTLAPHVARYLLPADSSGCRAAETTLDGAAQRAARDAVQRQMAALRGRGVRDAALLAVDNASGDVLAYVGSSGALSSAAQVDGVRARRQAGSTLKPFLYGLAIERRLLTAATRLDDAPLEIPVAGGLFRPRNYDDVFRGPVAVRTALAASLNVPAVRALQLVGADDFAQRLRDFGFDGINRPGGYYGPALALGAAEVTLWQLVGAYRTLANGGAWSPLRLSQGAAAAPAATRQALTPAAAFIVGDILADRDARAVTFGLESPLATRFWTAVKTGTSTDMRDNWCVGFSRRYTVGVWVGNSGGAPMRDVSGVTGAAPIWAEMMDWLGDDGGAAAPAPPAPATVERVGGDWFLPGTAPLPLAPPASRPRILSPTDGEIIALDPDIGEARQRVSLAAVGGAGLRWQVDGREAGAAATPLLWPPSRGAHEVALLDAAGRRAASARFTVR
ncbi:penicillin-binding protein 1C [bacterium]|nr:penicillin-binding protein 1C [bacterium]